MKREEKRNQYNKLRAMLIAMSLGLSVFNVEVEASETKEKSKIESLFNGLENLSDYLTDKAESVVENRGEIKDKAKGFLDKVVDTSDKLTDKAVDLVKNNAKVYKHESLKIVNAMPFSEDERQFYFIDESLGYTRNYYTNSLGEKVDKESEDAVYHVIQTNYPPIGVEDAKTYIKKVKRNIITGEIISNTAYLEKVEGKEEESFPIIDPNIEFTCYKEIDDIIPSEYAGENKFTTTTLEVICETLNDENYILEPSKVVSQNSLSVASQNLILTKK